MRLTCLEFHADSIQSFLRVFKVQSYDEIFIFFFLNINKNTAGNSIASVDLHKFGLMTWSIFSKICINSLMPQSWNAISDQG